MADSRECPCRAGEGGGPCGRVNHGSEYDVTQCLACWRHTHRLIERGRDRQSLECVPPPPISIPCVSLRGEATVSPPRSRPGHPGRVRLRECAVHGSCSPTVELDGIACCKSCTEYTPDTFTLVAPAGTRGRPGQWQGRLARRPWSFRVSVCIPHLETLPQLRLAVETLRWQSVRPYFIIIDTGSSPATCEELERLRCEDLEIHYLRSNGFFHASEPVAVALDFGHAI